MSSSDASKPASSKASAPPKQAVPSFTARDAGFVPGVDSGWSAMAKIVRNIDEEKISDYKEDIDTILVFAGLFSAVMTAFLIESYQNLQQSPQEVIVTLLQQLVVQTHTYSMNAGFLNSTTALPLPPAPFQPTVNAVRVNVLWFSSLVLSLISASFGILVKQWLREYLAGEYTSPQARLRIRHFRNPGLAHWKVFEIAAVLPMLLQLALALFFVGLCFFTADVHNSIRNATLPLVAGWGFLFLAASVAPALSARCPYKTTLLKTVMKWIRRRLYKSILTVRKTIGRSTNVPNSEKWSYHALASDEDEIVVKQDNDINILIAVDAIQSDERLLGVMWDALQQAQIEAAEAVAFLFKVISHRLALPHPVEPSPSSFLNLRLLSKSTFASIMDMAVDLLRRELRRQSPDGLPKAIEWSPWMKDCLYLLFSEGHSVSTSRADAIVSDCFADGGYKTVYELIKPRVGVASGSTFSALQRLRVPFLRMKGESMLAAVQDLIQATFCHDHSPSIIHSTLLDCIRQHSDMPFNVTQYVVDLHISCLANYFATPGFKFFDWQWPLMECSIRYSSVASANGAEHLMRKILISPFSYVYYRYAVGLENLPTGIKNPPELEETAQRLLIDIYLSSTTMDREAILKRLPIELNYQWRTHSEKDDDSFNRLVRMDPLKTCYIQLRLFQVMQERQEVSTEYLTTSLPKFWDALYDSLHLVAGRHYDGHAQLARTCLALIDTLEPCPVDATSEDTQAFSSWAHAFKPKGSAFEDRLISTLLEFTPDETPTSFARVRRIQVLHPEAQSGATPEGPRSSRRGKTHGGEKNRDEKKKRRDEVKADVDADADTDTDTEAEHSQEDTKREDDVELVDADAPAL